MTKPNYGLLYIVINYIGNMDRTPCGLTLDEKDLVCSLIYEKMAVPSL